MKYRVKEIRNDDWKDGILTILLWWFIPFMNTDPTWEIQYKKHWWNKWKTCDNYDRIEDAYRFLLDYQTDHKCVLPKNMKFPHNKIKGKYVWCQLQMGKLKTNDPKINDGKHYYAGYKPKNYARFYFCSYGTSYEDAIEKLWCELEVKKLIHSKDV